MKQQEVIKRLSNGERMVKTVSDTRKSIRIVLVPSNLKVPYQQYRKLLFDNLIKLNHYDKYNNMSYYEKAN